MKHRAFGFFACQFLLLAGLGNACSSDGASDVTGDDSAGSRMRDQGDSGSADTEPPDDNSSAGAPDGEAGATAAAGEGGLGGESGEGPERADAGGTAGVSAGGVGTPSGGGSGKGSTSGTAGTISALGGTSSIAGTSGRGGSGGGAVGSAGKSASGGTGGAVSSGAAGKGGGGGSAGSTPTGPTLYIPAAASCAAGNVLAAYGVCRNCHYLGGSGPSPLVTYADAKVDRETQVFELQNNLMPKSGYSFPAASNCSPTGKTTSCKNVLINWLSTSGGPVGVTDLDGICK